MVERDSEKDIILRFKFFARVVGLFAVLAGVSVFIERVFDTSLLKSGFQNFAAIKFNTALGISLCGLSLFLYGFEKRIWAPRIARLLAIIVVFIGILSMGEYIYRVYPRFDQFLFGTTDASKQVLHFGQMAPQTAFDFFILGLALVLIGSSSLSSLSQLLSFVVFAGSLLTLLGHFYGFRGLHMAGPFSSIALRTSVVFFLLSFGILSVQPDQGFMRSMTKNTAGGIMARWLLPAAVIAPIFLGWLRYLGQKAGYYDTAFGLALFAISNIFVFIILIFVAANRLNRVETSQLQAENKFRGLLEAASDAMVMTNQKGEIILVNVQTEKLFGYGQGELVGKPVEILVPECFRGVYPKLREEYFREPHSSPMGAGLDFLALRKNGSKFPSEISLTPLKIQEELVVILAIRDITLRKQIEAEIRKLNEELEGRVKQRTEELTAANKELESFSYSVSHDLRAPLRAISGFSNMLLEEFSDRLDDEGKRILNNVCSSSKRMTELIDDLLSFSRLGRKSLEISNIDMTLLAQSIVKEVQDQEPERKINIIFQSLPSAWGDSSLIHQVLFNLIDNAFKFTRNQKNPMIEIGGSPDNGENLYYVKDNGAGFDMQYANKLFGVFQRLHTTAEFEGTGVGLAIVERIVKRHGGRIWAEAKVGEGASFYFTLSKTKQEGGEKS